MCGVVGDVLDSFVATCDMRVLYTDGRLVISNGCNMRSSQMLTRPRVDVGGDDSHILYPCKPRCFDHCFVNFLSFVNVEFGLF